MLRLSDFASAVITAPVTAGATSVSVDSGALFPALGLGDFFYAVIQDVEDKRRQEIVKVVSFAADAFSVERTDGMEFSAGSFLELRLTSEALFSLMRDGASYHTHPQMSVETAVVCSYTGGVLTSVSSFIDGWPRMVSYNYSLGVLVGSVDVYKGRTRTTSYSYDVDGRFIGATTEEAPL